VIAKAAIAPRNIVELIISSPSVAQICAPSDSAM
jgi:hypothetical protein